MQVNNNVAWQQYAQGVQPAASQAVKNATAVTENSGQAAEAPKKEADTDRVELSKDANVTKMTDAERADLVNSLKADLDNQMSRFTNMMVQNFQKQGINASMANGDDFWKMMASGNYTVDAKTKAEAQEAISEDGFWGVKNTSQRIFDFAYALAGDDPEKMKKMQAAVEKGFEQATQAWGKSLPSIAQETHSAIGDLFDSYYEKAGKAE